MLSKINIKEIIILYDFSQNKSQQEMAYAVWHDQYSMRRCRFSITKFYKVQVSEASQSSCDQIGEHAYKNKSIM